MFKRKQEQSDLKLLRIELTRVTLSSGEHFLIVEPVTLLAKRLYRSDGYVFVHEFDSVSHFRKNLIRKDLITRVEDYSFVFRCDDLRKSSDRFNETCKKENTEHGLVIMYGKE